MKQSLQRQTMAERPKLSCTRDTLSVLGHTGAVIAVYILFHRVTYCIIYAWTLVNMALERHVDESLKHA